jgi:hypothetical protein
VTVDATTTRQVRNLKNWWTGGGMRAQVELAVAYALFRRQFWGVAVWRCGDQVGNQKSIKVNFHRPA